MTLTYKQVLNHEGANLPEPIYRDDEYMIVSPDRIVMATGSLGYFLNSSVLTASDYYHDCTFEARDYDISSGSNKKLDDWAWPNLPIR